MFRKSLARKKVQNIQKHFPAAAKVSPKSHRSAPYFPPNPLISPAPGTQTVIATIGFHFLCNWTRNGAGDKKGTFSNTCYLVFQQRRARQRLWFVQFAKFAKHCLPPKSCEPANAILPFPFRPPAALPSHRTFISISTFLCPLVCSYPFQVPRNSGQNGETLFRLSLDLLSVEFYFWGNLLRGMVVRKFPILVLSVFSWETWQKRLIGFPSMAVNNQSQMREAGQHCFLRGGGWGVGEVGAKTGLHRLTSCSIHAQHPQDWLYEQWGGSGLSICCSTEAIWILGRWAVASWLTWPWSVGLVW